MDSQVTLLCKVLKHKCLELGVVCRFTHYLIEDSFVSFENNHHKYLIKTSNQEDIYQC